MIDKARPDIDRWTEKEQARIKLCAKPPSRLSSAGRPTDRIRDHTLNPDVDRWTLIRV
jgi:hypothetical protein